MSTETTMTNEKPRVFVYNNVTYEDPNPNLSNEQVRDMLARTFGAIAGGEITSREETERTVVEFKPRPQRKGANERIAYTFGYGGHTMAELQAHIERTGGIVVDIRHNPTSRRPEWREGALRQALRENYLHIRALGNKYYNQPDMPIVIADMGLGMDMLRTHLAARDEAIILMCGCSDVAACHRKVVADALLAREWVHTVVHL